MGALDDPTDSEESRGESISPQASGAEPNSHTRTARSGASILRQRVIAGGLLLVTLGTVLPPLFGWQLESQRKALSLSNVRRIGSGCLAYAEDWDQRMPPPVQRMANGYVLAWPRLVRPYVLLDDAFSNPANPIKPFEDRPLLRDPADNHGIDTSYALNRRFWGQFAPGPFPIGNLEMPEQTVLLVEAGRMAVDPRHPRIAGPLSAAAAVDVYGDTIDRIFGLSPYPSVHGGQFCTVAVDGHAITTKVLYYDANTGPHDPLLGRLGDGVYNWNGGHSNGETDSPARE